jgi:hypothetical protein
MDIVKQIRIDHGVAISDGDDFEETGSNSKMYIDVRRDYFLKGALRECKKSKFDPNKLLRV